MERREVIGHLRMFDAMMLKRELSEKYKVRNVDILETSKDGLILRFLDSLITHESLDSIADFVEKHRLNILFDNGVYFISEKNLTPYQPLYTSE
jgi:hypothetical protein